MSLDAAGSMQENSVAAGPPYLMGHLGIDRDHKIGFKAYYLVAFLYKIPVATQAMILMACIGLMRSRERLKRVWRNEAFLIVPSMAFVIVFSLSNAQIGIRYVLMVFPLMFVFASGAAMSWSADRVRHRALVFGLLGYLVVSNLSYFPHYISYFNELVLDRKMAYTILADSNLDWGQNTSYLTRYLASNPDAMYTKGEVHGLQLPPERVFDPEHPKAGVLVIGVNELLGITSEPARYQWIRERLKPVEHVAYSFLVFHIRDRDMP
jgi:hypothetical protein